MPEHPQHKIIKILNTLQFHIFHFSIEQGLRPCTPQSVKEQKPKDY